MLRSLLLTGLWALLFIPTVPRASPTTPSDTTQHHIDRIVRALDSPYAFLQDWGLKETIHTVPISNHADTRLFRAVVRVYEQAVGDQRSLALAALISFDADKARASVHGHATESEQQAARDRWIRVHNERR